MCGRRSQGSACVSAHFELERLSVSVYIKYRGKEKALIALSECASQSEALLFAYNLKSPLPRRK